MEDRGVCIAGTGSFLPEKILTNADLEKMVDTSDEWITTRTGIKERRISDKNMPTSDIAVPAARKALEMAGIKPEEIDLIIVATITPDMIYPSTACLIQQKLGAKKAAAFDLKAACSGFIYSLAVAKAFIAQRVYDTVLVIGAEELSKIVDWTDRNNCILMGDGAGAVVLRPSPPDTGILETTLWADGSLADLLEVPAGGTRIPVSHESIDQKLVYMKMNNGKEVFKIGVIRMSEGVKNVLDKCHIDRGKIKLLIPHQANKRIIDAITERLDLPNEKVFVNIHKYGNTSAASNPIALDEAVRSGKINKGDIVVMTAFGAGLTMGACVIKW